MFFFYHPGSFFVSDITSLRNIEKYWWNMFANPPTSHKEKNSSKLTYRSH